MTDLSGEISVRPATTADGEAVGRIHAASWAAAYAPLFPEQVARAGIASRLDRWHERIATNDGLVLIGLVGERPLALSWSQPSQTRPGLTEIYSFYTHPDGWAAASPRR